jgi:uncharacterized protein YgiM (DUF1202 family)
MTDWQNRPPDDDDDNLDWLNDIEKSTNEDDLFGEEPSENVHGDRDRNAGIGQAQHTRIASRRMEESIERAEETDFGDTDEMLDWMADPTVNPNDLPDWLQEMPASEMSEEEREDALNTLQTITDDEDDEWIERVSTGELIEQEERMRLAQEQARQQAQAPVEDDGMPEWMSQGGFESDVTEEDSAPSWMAKSGFTDELNNDEGTPEWVASTGSTGQLDDNDSPSWVASSGFTGELNNNDSPSWVASSGFTDSLQANEDEANWMPSFGSTQEMQQAGAEFNDDADRFQANFDAFDADNSEQAAVANDLPSWLMDETPIAQASATDAPDLPSWLMDEQAPAASEEPNFDALFGDVFGEESTEPKTRTDELPYFSAEPQSLQGAGELPSWLNRLSTDELKEVQPSDSSQNLFGGRVIGGADFEPQPSGSIDADADIDALLASISSEDDDVSFLMQDIQTGTLNLPEEEQAEPEFDIDALFNQYDSEPVQTDDNLSEMFDPDLFDMSAIAELEDAPVPTRAKPVTGNLDDLFASGLLDSNPDAEPVRNDLLTDEDLDRFFATGLEDVQAGRPNELGGDLPEWLRQARDASPEQSIGAVLRQRDERSLEELDDRLLALRQEGQNLKVTEEKTSGLMEQLLPNVPEVLIPATFVVSSAGAISTGLVATPEQQKRAEILQTLVQGTEAQPRSDSQRRRRTMPLLRFAIVLLLLAATALPFFFDNLNIGRALVGFFEPNSEQQLAYDTIDNLNPANKVLFAVEYGTGSANEMDDITRAFLTHLNVIEAVPIIVSSNPVALTRTRAIAETIFTRPQGFYISQYIPSGSIGLRDFAMDIETYLSTDAEGNSTNLEIESLDRLRLIILVADNPEAIRTYMEQIAPISNTPFVFGTSYSALPFALPYLSTQNVSGLIAGYKDAAIYQSINNDTGVQIPVDSVVLPIEITEEAIVESTAEATEETVIETTPEVLPTEAPTTEPTLEVVATQEATAEATTEAIVETTVEAVATVVPTDAPTSVPTEAPATNTPRPTAIQATNTPRPTNTPAPSPTVSTIQVAQVIGTGSINVRESDNQNATVITTLQNGEFVRVIGLNADGSWVNIVLSDDRVGWVASFLVEVTEQPENTDIQFRKPLPESLKQQATPLPDEIVLVGEVITGSAQVLTLPNATGEVLLELNEGQFVRVLEIQGEWTGVLSADNQIGWVETFALDIREVGATELATLTAPEPTAGVITIAAPTATIRPGSTAVPTQTNTPRPTNTARATNTPRPSATPTLEATQDTTLLTATVQALEVLQTAQSGLTVDEIALTATALNFNPEDALLTATALMDMSAEDLALTATALNFSAEDALLTATAFAQGAAPVATEIAPTEIPTEIAPSVIVSELSVPSDRRWYAQNLGLRAAIAIIAGGSVFYLIRGITQRRR